MESFSAFFHLLLYKPLFNVLVLLYQFLPGRDFGIAIISLTLLIKLALYPLGSESIKIQRAVQSIQPKIKELQKKYKQDRQKLAAETMDLYKKERINPFAGLFLSLVQIPILIALWRIFWGGFQPEKLADVYSFLPNPGLIDPTFLGFLNLEKPSAILAVFAGISQFLQTKTMTPQTKKTKQEIKVGDAGAQFSSIMEKQMLYFFPFLTVFILWKLPSALALYWLVTALFSVVQQSVLLRKNNNQNT
ncbi:MAG: hypothetical protein A3F15_00740 [Candidatus Wildermuthbacteria bacterium RIFCSPHIGHO2_12_FULL_40_12]|uniref:Membrane insertase YidC/Oxa/ALB C-terminal domain-containing protein n=1 Tax=Candidatus Wildermuthbacteria bacterium RIFCSPHIGHO2_12_FULL_40_12 TaxID=1802457 RepID=A0A1G2RB13_9BACT|nr:MAG: hypothetical protein A3F15_00740 [Candidatus Wildermuthbacteria bacterium RIFCSPHIGHO2_12_FULL_40_12]